MRITLLAGGVGGARFALGLRDAARELHGDADIRIVTNVGDDVWLAGVKVCPDLDSLLYALAGVGDTERGWGRAGESERVAAELTAYGVGWPWFTLGDLDLGTHLARTAMLRDGATLTEATARLAARWPLGATLLPVTDDEVPTHVVTDEGVLHFEEWWVRTRAQLRAHRFVQHGVERSRIAPAARAAIAARARNEEVRALWSKSMQSWVDFSSDVIRSEQARGAAPGGIDAHELAVSLNLMNERVITAVLNQESPAIAESSALHVLSTIWIRSIYGSDNPGRR